MINSIRNFVEKETYEIENIMRKFVEGELDLDTYGKELQEKTLQLTRDILVETLEEMDETIRNSARRQAAYVVEQKGQPKELLMPVGRIRFKRTCYTSKKTGKSVYLLDRVIGLGKHQRITLGAAAAILEETVESSYEKGGKHASVSDWVSKETVKELVHKTVECVEKKKVRCLHIEADEDHVAAQFYEKKGDLERGENGRKKNTLMPKLVLVYEDIVEESGENSRSRRYRLEGKRYFCGLYSGKDNEKLWEEVRDYICGTYDWESLETVYIAGDGAGWIKAGCEILEKGKFVLDRFHMGKYIDRSVSHLLDSAGEVKEEIYEAVGRGDKGKVREIYKKIQGVTEKESKEKEVRESLGYLMNNWEGIVIYQKEAGEVWGCHAEGQVSHVLSGRMSSRPMGWSRKGADQMSRLRAYRMNGGKIIDLLKYQEGRKKREEAVEKKDELVREVRKRQAGRKYAEQLQGSIPGLEAHPMKWMRDLVGQGISYIA